MTAVVLTAPYRGLVPYGEADAPFFFGRDTDRRLVVANMESEPLTTLFGPSGVGKTSFLHAAVLHHFRKLARRRVEAGGAPELAAVVFSSWRDEPVQALRAAVMQAVEEALGRHPDSSPPDGFAETTSWAADSVQGSLHLILDQLEDYFLYWPSDAADRFGAELPRAVSSAAGRVSFLLSLREDALGRLDRFKGRIPGLFANYLRLDHLDREVGREAIERPLKVLHAAQPQAPGRIEPALVEGVLDSVDAGAEAIGVAGASGRGRIEAPFLQVILARVWEAELAEGSDVLRVETLHRLGGPERVIEGNVNDAMATLALHERELASAVLQYLVNAVGCADRPVGCRPRRVRATARDGDRPGPGGARRG
jgi:hypothetical protein